MTQNSAERLRWKAARRLQPKQVVDRMHRLDSSTSCVDFRHFLEGEGVRALLADGAGRAVPWEVASWVRDCLPLHFFIGPLRQKLQAQEPHSYHQHKSKG
jgi:hypothetical protein